MRQYNDRTPHRLMPLASRHTRSRRAWQDALDNPGGSEPPPAGPDFIVTGDGDPSPNGEYTFHHSDEYWDWYYNETETFQIEHRPTTGDAFLSALPWSPYYGWENPQPGIPGTYEPWGDATGNPVVAAA